MNTRLLSIIPLFFLLCLWAEAQKPPLQFAFLTDLHVTPGSVNGEHLRKIVEEINLLQPDLVIVTGDLTNQGSDLELIYVKQILDGLRMPTFVLPGNHETNWSESGGRTFNKFWGDDRFIFSRGDFVFAGINTGPFMRMGDGHVKLQDIRWLNQHLDKKMQPGSKLLFFAHYPLAEGLDQWYKITEILHQHNTVAAFCGHGHMLRLLNFDQIPGIMGRSLVLRGDNIPGYNLVEISTDSIWVYEKILSEPRSIASISFAINDPSTTQGINVSPLPDYSVNELFYHIQPAFPFRDTVSVFSGPLVLGDTMVVYGDSEGWLKNLTTNTGEMQWQIQLRGAIFSTPAISGTTILAADIEGWVYGVDSESGRIIWETYLAAPIVAKPLVDGGHFYLGAAKAMYKLETATGDILWRFDHANGLIQSKPALEGNNLIFTSWDTHVYSIDSQTGTLRWKWNNGRPVNLLSPGNVNPVISNGKVFIVAPDRFMTALSLETGEQLWRTNRHQVRESMGISQDGNRVFAKLMTDSVIAVSTTSSDFQTYWVKNAGFGYDHNPVPVVTHGNMLYIATRNGLVVAMDQKEGNLIWKHKVGNSAVNFFCNRGRKYLWLTTTCGKVIALPY